MRLRRKMKEVKVDMDEVLNEIGQFGRFQKKTLILAAISSIGVALVGAEYLMSTTPLNYRCKIPECDGNFTELEPSWIADVIPVSSSGYDQCFRYARLENSTFDNSTAGYCDAEYFDKTLLEPCQEYVYELTNSVVYDYGLECQSWKRTIIGSYRQIGSVLALPLAGFVSDNYGRKFTIIVCSMFSATLGLARYFAPSYEVYVFLQVAEATLGGGWYLTSFVLASELMGSNSRSTVMGAMGSGLAVGYVSIAPVAWWLVEWRNTILAIFVPQLLYISYIWLSTESPRWLMTIGKYSEAEKIVHEIAKANGVSVPEHINEKFKKAIEEERECTDELSQTNKEASVHKENIFLIVFKTPVILYRLIVAPFWWISTIFIYYGLSVTSVNLNYGNMYVNYVLTNSMQLPGFLVSIYAVEKFGRRATLLISFYATAVLCGVYPFIPGDYLWISQTIYIMSMLFISMGLAGLYLLTAELFPTQYRQTLVGFTAMVGRIGGILAPLSPALLDYWKPMLFLIYSALALVASFLLLTVPETLNTRMPDTAKDVENTNQTAKEYKPQKREKEMELT